MRNNPAYPTAFGLRLTPPALLGVGGLLVAGLVACSDDGTATPTDPPGSPNVAAVCEPTGAEASWTFTLLSVGTKPALTVGSDGTVHASSIYESNDGWVNYTRMAPGQDPSPAVTVAQGYFYGPIDINLDLDGRPTVQYHDHTRTDQIVASLGANNAWSLQAMTNAGHDGWYNSGTFDSIGRLHTATYDPGGFGGRGVIYGLRDGSTWQIELAAPGSFDYAGGLSIAVAPDGTVYVAFFDDAAGLGRIAHRSSDGTWDVQDIEPRDPGLLETGRFPKIVLAADGITLHLTYLARQNEAQGVVRYATGELGALSVRDVADVSDFSIGFSGARDLATLALDAEGLPVIALQTRSSLTVLRLADDTIETLGSFGTPNNVTFGQQTDIDIDDQGNIHVAWWQTGGAIGNVCHAVR